SSQAKNVAATIAAQMAGEEAPPWTGSNTCYSFISEKYGISVVAIYAVKDGKRVKVKGAGGVAFKGKSLRHHAKEAKYARGWYKGITSDMFG
ncbi:MAG: FCSD flavin-binding domain-containing protein, partial [Arenicellales bacterium]|nr:FCSD flavin-binding domain-containing protein [Arenicellales bacterium]